MLFMTEPAGAWRPSVCILCECNCGVEIQLGSDGRSFQRIRGDKAHPASAGYTCNKALRLDHYQNGRNNRITRPQRRRADGSFEEIGWDTAISEIAARFGAVRDAHGGKSIFYYGGGGQGNHLGGMYSTATMQAFGAKYRSSALAQEKTGEFWVDARMLGGYVRADVENAEMVIFVGKNPYQSHGFPRARAVLKEIARDADRTMIVIDPVRTETAELADVHLAPRPGTDVYLLAALAAVLVQEDLLDREWLTAHADGLDEVREVLAAVPIDKYATIADISVTAVRDTARRIAAASSVAVLEDLGVQMNRDSTLVSYVEKLIWLLTGNFAKPGTQHRPSGLGNIGRDRGLAFVDLPRSPVVGAPIISGLVPCNVITEEILTDHPARYRAMLVESANPAHSLADSPRMREALRALDTLVVIDVAMTETARLADYVLPASTQFEKWEATFFNFEFPSNVFHLRAPVLPAPEGPLPEPEIHARLVEASGALTESELAPLRAAAAEGRAEFTAAFLTATAADPKLSALAPVVLYRTLGPSLPDGAAAAAALWGLAHACARTNADGVAAAGFGTGIMAGEALFEAILRSPHGVVFTEDTWDTVWTRTRDGKAHLALPELLADLAALADREIIDDPDWPFVLSAGERRAFSANTIIRDPNWRRRGGNGALRISTADAHRLDLAEGDRVRVTTATGTVEVPVEPTDRMRSGHISLPNGFGLDTTGTSRIDLAGQVGGVAANELTTVRDRDPWAGTPLHKFVPARVESLPADR